MHGLCLLCRGNIAFTDLPPEFERCLVVLRNLSAERTKARQHTAALSSQPPTDQPGQPSLSAQRKAARAAATALAHVWFQQEDFVTAEHGPGSMDCVLCLSVTKWVHLNGGDAAVLQLFDMVHHVLSSGGHFVLEAQPWRSYKQAQRKTVAPYRACFLYMRMSLSEMEVSARLLRCLLPVSNSTSVQLLMLSLPAFQ